MSKEKLRVARTETDNLISNLRGEIGEIITTWIIMRHFMKQKDHLASGDIKKDLGNEQITFLDLLEDKLSDEMVARLSEIAENKMGRVNFHFAARKLSKFQKEASAFSGFVAKHRFREKRNRDISHKDLSEKRSEDFILFIPYYTIRRATAMALRLMKRIDRHVLGPSAPYRWHEARKRRYDFKLPPRVAYMLIPYLPLSPENRLRISIEEETTEPQP